MRLRTLPALLLACTLLAATLPAAALGLGKKGAVTLRTKLPQDHEYQRNLRKHLGTLTEKDFTHGIPAAPLKATPTATDNDYLYRNYLLTLMHQPLVGTKRGTPAINAPPALFLLSNVESEQGVMQLPVWPETLTTFINWKYPGNVYHGNRALKLRAYVTASVMMIMLDDALDQDVRLHRGDWFSYQLVYFGHSYAGFKDALPPEAQQAYAAGLKRMVERMLSWGIKGEEPQADLIGPLGLFCAAKALDDAELLKKVETFARQLYTEPRYFNPAGYWVFRGGPDIPFGGQANFFAASTGLATGWPFVKEALDRSYKLRGHLILRDPDGWLHGPSHFNSRVSGPASVDQWAWDNARDSAAAMLTDEAVHLVKLPTAKELHDAPAKKAGVFSEQIRENPYSMGKAIRNEEITSHPWKWRVWMTFNFPASVNPGYEFYRQGAYARQQEFIKQNSPMLKSPFERGDNFVRELGKEFIIVKQPSFAAILHVGPIGSQDPSDKMHQYKGPMGLSGGQLSAFWTPRGGSVLLGQRGGMTYDKSLDLVEAWRTWPIHAVSGATTDGTFFTSARIQKPETTIALQCNKAEVQVAGSIPAAIVGQEKTITGKYDYQRAFVLDDKSVTVTTTIRGDGKERIAELYETLPVYLRDVSQQPKAIPTIIELQSGGKWVPATDKFADGVQAIRLTRFEGKTLITFDKARRVKLSPADWTDPFMSRGSGRTVLIDLLENNDQPTTLTAAKTVRYTITPQ